MTLYIGVDICARQQTLSYLYTEDGTTGQVELDHEVDDPKTFRHSGEKYSLFSLESLYRSLERLAHAISNQGHSPANPLQALFGADVINGCFY